MGITTSNKGGLKTELLKHGFPQMMLTRNTRSFIGSGISGVTKGFYNHFCWLYSIDEVASQDWAFRLVKLDDYLTDKYVVKFVTDTRWTNNSKQILMGALDKDLNAPLYKRLYDPVAILGQLTGLKWLQLPIFDICSDYGRYLKLTDNKYKIKHPCPSSINVYQKENQATVANKQLGYLVTARFIPEDI
jgi:hypothetical protein